MRMLRSRFSSTRSLLPTTDAHSIFGNCTCGHAMSWLRLKGVLLCCLRCCCGSGWTNSVLFWACGGGPALDDPKTLLLKPAEEVVCSALLCGASVLSLNDN